MQAEILLTLKLQQKLFADPRRISLLKHIALSGSISQGAKDAGISYKSAWDAINEMNQLSEHILVERATGGKGDAPRDKCTLSCAINGIHAAFHYLKKNYISGCVMTVPTGW